MTSRRFPRFRIRTLIATIVLVGVGLGAIRSAIRYSEYRRIARQIAPLAAYERELRIQIAEKERELDSPSNRTDPPSAVRLGLARADLDNLREMIGSVTRRIEQLDEAARRIWGPAR